MEARSVLLSLASVSVGWLLGLLTIGITRWKAKRALLEELTELDDECWRLWTTWSRSLQIVANGGVDTSAPLPLSHHIFMHHYKDAALALNKFQRRSIQMIHSYVDSINSETEKCRKLVEKIHGRTRLGDPINESDFQEYRDYVKNNMGTVAVLQWHIRYHFENSIFPELDVDGVNLPSYRKYLHKIRELVDAIEKSGEGIGLEEFKKLHVP